MSIDCEELPLSEEILRCPLVLPPNRVRRTYQGGALLDEFRGYPDPKDSWYPEDWVGSTVLSRIRDNPAEGLSRARLGNREFTLRDLVKTFPEPMLGARHVQCFGADPFVLVKLIDSSVRLRIQVHPTREVASQLLQSPHGKTEAWIILATRTIGDEAPSILVGFQEAMRPEAFCQAAIDQDRTALKRMLHRVDVSPGDVFFIEAGTPHAIGPGVFMVEVQEPSDHTIYVEPTGNDLLAEGASNHLGLGWDTAFKCFTFKGLPVEEVLRRWKRRPRVVRHEPGGEQRGLLDGPEIEP